MSDSGPVVRFRYDVELPEKQVPGVRESVRVRIHARSFRHDHPAALASHAPGWHLVGHLMIEPDEWAAVQKGMAAEIAAGRVIIRNLGRPPLDPDLEKRRAAVESARRAAQSAAARKGVR